MVGESRDFGPYRLIRRLGVGGMAETFEAARLGEGGFEQRVCLKRVLPAYGDDPDFVARFRQEAVLAARLRHTNIVGIIDAGEVDGAHYMALELVDGVDLRSLLRSSPEHRLDPDTVVSIAIDLAYALEHAHETLVHRDISPSNILLGRSGDAKLADFGIAKAVESAEVTASRSANGKVPYMAPERMRGESVDARADLFSLGVVMFEAVAGRRPFDGAHDVETMQRILANERLSLGEVAPDLSPMLAKVIDSLLEVDREARTPSAHALLDQLAEVAPPPSVKRALAAHIEGFCGGPETRLHVRGQDEERDTELTALPESVSPTLPTERDPVRQRRRLLPAVLAAVAVAAAIASYEPPPEMDAGSVAGAGADAVTGPDTGTGTGAGTVAGAGTGADTDTDADSGAGADTATVSAPAPGLARATDAAPAPAPDSAPAPATDSAPEPATVPPRPTPAWLTVIVEPWGNVWIDGRYFGRAPVEVRLSGGRHVVAVGRELPARREIVRLRPGTRRELALTLGAD